jgi:two-component system chemotaxis response regulator CheB
MKTRVLVVDDSPLIRAVLREAFERTTDLTVVGEAGDGHDALEKVEALRPDLVTMDVLMPKMDGLAATREIMRLRPTRILVIARDGGDAGSLAAAALGHGAMGVFPKPAAGFDEAVARELAEVIRQTVRERLPVGSIVETVREASRKIRVLVVDDSPLVRHLLRAAMAQASDLEVVGEAGDGLTAIRKASELKPDVVTLDLLMPMMDGRETAQALLRTCNPGILVVTQETEIAEQLVQSQAGGAVELFVKPSEGLDEAKAAEMVQSIRRLAQLASTRPIPTPTPARRLSVADTGKIAVVGIVGSTGAPRVLYDLVAGLPSDFPAPIVLVQHTERGLAETLTDWLGSVATMPVLLGTAGQVLVPGEIVVAPDGLHMEVQTGGIVHLHAGEPVDSFRPSGTVLLTSLARTFGAYALGLVLSGMGTDGADGLGAIQAAGGHAVVEDPLTAAVPGMPKRALLRASGALTERAPRLASLLVELVGGGRSHKIAL